MWPAGPPPMIRTSTSSGSSGVHSRPSPAAGCTRGSPETYPWWWNCMEVLPCRSGAAEQRDGPRLTGGSHVRRLGAGGAPVEDARVASVVEGSGPVRGHDVHEHVDAAVAV